MCAISGKAYFAKNEVHTNEIRSMLNKLRHRGPDDSGIYISKDRKVGLGNNRLAIIDLSKNGHQPMQYLDRYVITFNGEVYNFQEEREKLKKAGYKFKSNTDTEVILALYSKYGKKCVDHLRGMFAFCIYDEVLGTLFLARDRIGKKPIKYFLNDSLIIFASELKAILTQPEVKAHPDFEAINLYLTYGYTPAPYTGFSGIKKLEPGTFMHIDLKRKIINKKKYWQPKFDKKLHLSEKEWCQKILGTLEEATKLRMISDVPVGAFLSGGVDSSGVVAAMAQLSNKPIQTFTIGYKDKEWDESNYAKKNIQYLQNRSPHAPCKASIN